jgi:ribonucleoside-diphosphate reductase alpha chain
MSDEITPSATQPSATADSGTTTPSQGLTVPRHFTAPGVHPFDEIEWETRRSAIYSEKGEVVFENNNVEVPKFWSQLATDILVHKYFRRAGVPGAGSETSAKQVVYRVAHTIRVEGEKAGYFATPDDAETFEMELTHLLVHQMGAFNSPVWFNCGLAAEYGIQGSPGNWWWDDAQGCPVEIADSYLHPQNSACFIQSVDDDLGSIFELVKHESRLFKYGSGTGTNFSRLRGSMEKLSSGGTSSGLMSFLEVFDKGAGATKSGGTTRRAAKMVILDMDHPEIAEFINWKAKEEKKAHILIRAGYPTDFNGEAYRTVSGQNSNNSVRITDAFMDAYLKDGEWKTTLRTTGEVYKTYRARDLMHQIAEAAWTCADPGVQFDSTINDWHTCSNTDRIHATNPCVTGDTLVATSEGYRRIRDLVGEHTCVVTGMGRMSYVTRIFPTGRKAVYELRTQSGYTLRLTADHKVYTENRGDVPASDLVPSDRVVLEKPAFGAQSLPASIAEVLGAAVGDGCITGAKEFLFVTVSKHEAAVAEQLNRDLMHFKEEVNPRDRRAARRTRVATVATALRINTSSRPVIQMLQRYAVLDEGSSGKRFRDAIFTLDKPSLAAVLRGLFTTDGTVANYGEKSQYVALDSSSLELLRQVQLLLLAFGIKAKLYKERRVPGETETMLPDGKGGWKVYSVKQMHSLRVTRESRVRFEQEIGFMPGSLKAKQLAALNQRVGTYHESFTDRVAGLTYRGEEEVYDLTEPLTSHFVANGMVVHNCSEYVFLDDSACNLASLNLVKFLGEDGTFDVQAYRAAIRIFVIAQEVLVDWSSYPTRRICQNSHDYRPLGLGYANMGTLLMVQGIPYESEAGFAMCGALTAILGGHAYAVSAEIASVKRPFAGFANNREPMLRVVNKHRAAVYRIHADHCPPELLKAAQEDWDRAVRLGQDAGYRNAQVTVTAPTGTIGLLLDCDTTGIEPDFALVKFKKLAGGGYFKIINQSVPHALRTLGYTDKQIEDIVTYALGTATFFGAPYINTVSLEEAGLTPAEIERVEKALPGMMDLQSAFSVYTLGEEALHRLGFPPEQHNSPKFHLLHALGFTPRQIEEATKVICGTMTVEGAPHLKAEHLPVFDCASKCGPHGTRFISPMGHIRMMAAAQPFLSGAISKTVNMPREATVEDVESAYVEAWRLGLKAIAVYRDGSKMSQPLSTGAAEEEAEAAQPRPVRHRLPDERQAVTHKFSVGGHEGYITVGLYDDGSPGEVFITMSKEGSTISGLMDAFATMVSVALQYGVPLDALVRKFSHMRFEPQGFTNNPKIPMAKSVIDYIFRWMGHKFLDDPELNGAPAMYEDNGTAHLGNGPAASPRAPLHGRQNASGRAAAKEGETTLEAEEHRIAATQSDAPACHTCGSIMLRTGSCYVCTNCGSNSGCS